MSSFICSLVLLLLAPLASCHGHHGGTVLVLGATGRTGSLLYKDLKKTSRHEVRALIRSTDKARDILGCDKCDESEGIYLGDITNVTSMIPAFEHVQTVAIATGLSGRGSPTQEVIRSIEFDGIQNAVKALAQETNIQAYGGVSNLRVVLCSSRGTTTPSSGVFGDILFYKLNAEVFLGSIGMTTSIVKPCGLSTQAGQNRTLKDREPKIYPALLSLPNGNGSNKMTRGSIRITTITIQRKADVPCKN
ncbi:3-beta hydroxysteroid dehydrogenase/isomerase family [Seminavis robusta]|uniref:3-beta hydroxysteroid dehydrogenase/isomerase family n=1 Tax=Seminavis robusta TaxID=568900 RepID=A0A9N8HK51_9STRA|nr:3-beta hydroxysteroid dehydrogenase/isomerase family [Seminavis robusta]|eukprot:Sro593_g172280.1 3-beta hydroxysteroid dehydrogenase/isomerase family (248) ;mRNA; f:21661-22537